MKVHIGPNAFDTLGFDDRDLDDLESLADNRGGYWVEASKFVIELKDKIEAELSFKQIKWATDISDKLEDLRRRGKL